MDQGKNTEQWYSKLFRMLNSAICFSVAYILFTYAFWFATGFAGRLFKFDAFVYYYGIKFLLNNHSWDSGKVTLIYMTGPVFCLVLGLVCLFFYKKMESNKTMLNVFLVWAFVIGTGIFVGQGVVAVLGTYNYQSDYYQGLSVVYSWWKLPVFMIYVLNIPLLLLFLYFAINYARPFLLFAYSYAKVNKLSRRRKYFFETAIVPFVLGAVFTGMVTVTMDLPVHVNIPMHIIYMCVMGAALVLAWFSISYVEVLKKDITRFKSFQTPNLAFAVLLGIVLVLVYISFRGVYIA